jgi:hypothetical protein
MQRHPSHANLDALVGEWRFAATSDGEEHARGRATGEWIEGGAFLLLRAESDHLSETWTGVAPFPTTSIVAFDDHTATFTYSYADARGVCRVYPMTLGDGVWTLSGRPGAEFFQRFEAEIGADAIRGHWERSADGEAWQRDFDLSYTRIA